MPSLPSIDATYAPHMIVGGDKLVSYQHSGLLNSTRKPLELYSGNLFTESRRSASEETGNVLLKFTVPKAIGKRKRGSDTPFESLSDDDRHREPESLCLKRSLTDNPNSSKVTAVGQLLTHHAISGLPDFRSDPSGSKLGRSTQRHILSQEFRRFSSFKLESVPGARHEVGMIPPPVLANDDLPFPWGFRSNPFLDSGEDTQHERSTTLKSRPYDTEFHFVKYDVKEVPRGPKPEWTAESALKPGVQDLIARMRSILQNQAIVTRRVLNNHLTPERDVDLRTAIDYCGYRFSSGPWRDAIVRYRYDPRTDPANRYYQTISFQKDKSESTMATAIPQNGLNQFDGTSPPVTPRTYQVCEITDELLRGIVGSEPPRRECAMLTSGWFNTVVWAKVRTIMRDKIVILASGGQPDDRDYVPLLELPNTTGSLGQTKTDRETLNGTFSPKQIKLMQEIRTEARKPALLQVDPDQDVEEEYEHLRSTTFSADDNIH